MLMSHGMKQPDQSPLPCILILGSHSHDMDTAVTSLRSEYRSSLSGSHTLSQSCTGGMWITSTVFLPILYKAETLSHHLYQEDGCKVS